MRLNKYLSETGACSRREADAWIAAGRVTVNGRVAALGTQVQAVDDVRVDGRPVGSRAARVYLALNKPRGVECTTDRDVPENIVDFVGHDSRIFPVGRLDKDSEGLILLTNDGDIVNGILRSEHGHEKEYLVSVDRPITQAFIEGMARGVPILGTADTTLRSVSGRQEQLPHRAHAGTQPADTADVPPLRLQRAAPAARADHAPAPRAARPGGMAAAHVGRSRAAARDSHDAPTRDAAAPRATLRLRARRP